MSRRKKILWLPSWYPNKYDAFDGDFIQRHAKAAALYHDVYVLFIKQFPEHVFVEEEKNEGNDGLVERLIYLPKKKGPLGRLANFIAWQRCYRKTVKVIVEIEKPHLIHVHVPWKAGLMALWAKREFNLPYIVTEHWGIYNTVAEDNIYTKPFLFRQSLKRIYQQAASFVSVSRYLGEGLNRSLVKEDFTVIPNVVDTALFFPSSDKYERFTFVHVSNMVPLKNVEGILEAYKFFISQTKADARLILIGNKEDSYQLMAAKLNLSADDVSFKGETSYDEVANEVRRCHAFILNSHIENSPCVIGEALCCGLPVIATAVGGIPELINEENGIIISPQNPKMLALAMKEMYQDSARFNADKIAAAAEQKFSPPVVSEAFNCLYQSL